MKWEQSEIMDGFAGTLVLTCGYRVKLRSVENYEAIKEEVEVAVARAIEKTVSRIRDVSNEKINQTLFDLLNELNGE